MATLTLAGVLGLWKALVAEIEHWEHGDGPNVAWGRQVVKRISDELDLAIRTYIDAMADVGREVAEQAYPLLTTSDSPSLSKSPVT